MKHYLLLLLILPIGFLVIKHNEIRQSLNTIEVVTYNINNIKEDWQLMEVCATIKSMGIPDLLLLQEVHGTSATGFLAENLRMPFYHYIDYMGDDSGLAILSRKPLENRKILYFSVSRYGYGALAAETKIVDRNLVICSLHLDRILEVRSESQISCLMVLRLLQKEIFTETVRSCSVKELIDWLAEFKNDYIIIGGDFNSFPLSRPIRKMMEKYNDALWPTTKYFNGTYTELDYPIKPRIDFLFHSPVVKRYRVDVINKGPSDHYPVKSIFGMEVNGSISECEMLN